MSKDTKKIFDPKLRLHNELIEFYQMMGPSKKDIKVRNQMIEDLKQIICMALPKCKVYPFGSFTTKLYLPHSDIDISVCDFDKNEYELMESIAQIFQDG